jgi:hypothetical protein
LHFSRIMNSLEEMQAWKGNGNGLSFVITHESPDGPGFRGETGFMASWRPEYGNDNASVVAGSPFDTFDEAESACRALACLMIKARPTERRMSHINFSAPAVLRKWPSLHNERRDERSPYVLFEGTLDECLGGLIAKPITSRHLYDISVMPASPALSAVLPSGLISEFARMRDLR